MLPVQYVMVGNQNFDLFSVFIPVYVFLAIPVISALGMRLLSFLQPGDGLGYALLHADFGLPSQ